MGGNGGVNAHNNAFGGGKNPGIGDNGAGKRGAGSRNQSASNSSHGANVGVGGSMDIDMGNGMTMHVVGVHALSSMEDNTSIGRVRQGNSGSRHCDNSDVSLE